MKSSYYYLIPSLPMLQFMAKPPFSFEKFLENCENFIPDKDFKIISKLPEPKDYEKFSKQPIVAKWCLFDMALRNELVRVRASRSELGRTTHRHIHVSKYLRMDGISNQEIPHIALTAQRNPSVVETEKFLDETRWKKLEELSFGHYFDLDFLIIYAYKLLILERWEKVRSANGLVLLEGVLS